MRSVPRYRNAVICFFNATSTPSAMEARITIAKDSRKGNAAKGITHKSSIEPVLGCIFLLDNRTRRNTRTCRRCCAPSSVNPVNLLHTRNEILLLDRPRGSRGLHLQFQPWYSFAAVRPFCCSGRRCGIRNFLRKEDAVIRRVRNEVESRCARVDKVVVTRNDGLRTQRVNGPAAVVVGNVDSDR